MQNRVIRAKLPLRCLWLVLGLKRWHQAVKMPRLYIGDEKLARRFAFCSESSVRRAKKDLETLHLVHVSHTRGGSTRNPDGKLVPAATGYEPHPDLYIDAEQPRDFADLDRGPRKPATASDLAASLRSTWAAIQARREARAGP